MPQQNFPSLLPGGLLTGWAQSGALPPVDAIVFGHQEKWDFIANPNKVGKVIAHLSQGWVRVRWLNGSESDEFGSALGDYFAWAVDAEGRFHTILDRMARAMLI